MSNNWYAPASLVIQLSFLIAGVWFARNILRTMRASQEQLGAMLKFSITGVTAEWHSSTVSVNESLTAGSPYCLVPSETEAAGRHQLAPSTSPELILGTDTRRSGNIYSATVKLGFEERGGNNHRWFGIAHPSVNRTSPNRRSDDSLSFSCIDSPTRFSNFGPSSLEGSGGCTDAAFLRVASRSASRRT